MYQCSNCHGYFDAGELRRGVCDECRRNEEQDEIWREEHRQMLRRNLVVEANGQLALGGILG